MSDSPLNFLQASVRANELVANNRLGIGTHTQTAPLHVKAAAAEIRLEDGENNGQVTETALKISADGGVTSFQSGTSFTDGTTGEFKFQNMGATNTYMTVNSDEVAISGNVHVGTANLFVDTTTGRVGVGVTELTSTFEVAGNTATQQYPPVELSNYHKYVTNHGVFRITASGYGNASYNAPHYVFDRFDNPFSLTNLNYWEVGVSYSSSTGLYSGDKTTTTTDGTTYSGEWIQLELPYAILLKNTHIYHRYSQASPTWELLRLPQQGAILGSNSGYEWETIYTFSSLTHTGLQPTNINVDTTKYYKTIRLVTTAISAGSDTLNIGQWRLFGTPAPSSLEDGHLTLGKALTMPRVSGHPAGAETPRAGSLILHFDTTVSTVASEGSVVDTSGNRRNGIFYNNTSYSSTDRAFVFDGTDDYIKVFSTGVSGDYVHSISFWIYNNNHNTNPFWIGENVDGKRINIYLPTSGIDYSFRGDTVSTTTLPPINRWWHLAVTYNGTQGISGRKIYIDGVEQTTVHTGTAAALNITNSVMYLGTNYNQGADLDGKMSNIKIWKVALTAEEVAAEYALGRSGKSLNITDTAMCLGGRLPRAQLDVRGSAVFDGIVGIGVTPASRLELKPSLIYNGETSASFIDATMGCLGLRAANNSNARWNLVVHENNDLYFLYTTSGSGGWGVSGYLMDNSAVNQIDFTGQHRSFIDGVPYSQYTGLEGLIVSANKNKYYDIDKNLTAGSNAIQISQSLPLVSLSSVAKDKACFGVISGSEDPERREYAQGSFVSVTEKQVGDTRAFINSVGEGAIWVTNVNGPLESGDYITTSNVAGYGMRQDDDVLHNYTVAKITMDCDFAPATQPVQVIKKEISNVNYWVETTYSNVALEEYSDLAEENRRTVTTTWYTNGDGDITLAEYSNLAPGTQSVYSEIESVTYQKIERKETTTEQEGWTLEVREELVNALDEHGQLQWEDHPTETEKAYKIRYLTADGVITDEANAVHIAAFVGCTYHCG